MIKCTISKPPCVYTNCDISTRTQTLQFYIYKLAVIANMKLQSLSSCGDIAVSVYTGWLAYSTFDHEWVSQQIEDTSVNEVLNKNWPGLHIEPLQPPENMEVLIGW